MRVLKAAAAGILLVLHLGGTGNAFEPDRVYAFCVAPQPWAPAETVTCNASSDDGRTIEMNGFGRFGPGHVSGQGAWFLRDRVGLLLNQGIWQAVSLQSFQSYGSLFQQQLPSDTPAPVPPIVPGGVTFNAYPAEGGSLRLEVSLIPTSQIVAGTSSGFQAFLTVGCALGGELVPATAIEGIQVSSPLLGQFLHTQIGATHFLQVPVADR